MWCLWMVLLLGVDAIILVSSEYFDGQPRPWRWLVSPFADDGNFPRQPPKHRSAPFFNLKTQRHQFDVPSRNFQDTQEGKKSVDFARTTKQQNDARSKKGIKKNNFPNVIPKETLLTPSNTNERQIEDFPTDFNLNTMHRHNIGERKKDGNFFRERRKLALQRLHRNYQAFPRGKFQTLRRFKFSPNMKAIHSQRNSPSSKKLPFRDKRQKKKFLPSIQLPPTVKKFRKQNERNPHFFTAPFDFNIPISREREEFSFRIPSMRVSAEKPESFYDDNFDIEALHWRSKKHNFGPYTSEDSGTGRHASPSEGRHAPSSEGRHAPSSEGRHAPSSEGRHAPSLAGRHAPSPEEIHESSPEGRLKGKLATKVVEISKPVPKVKTLSQMIHELGFDSDSDSFWNFLHKSKSLLSSNGYKSDILDSGAPKWVPSHERDEKMAHAESSIQHVVDNFASRNSINLHLRHHHETNKRGFKLPKMEFGFTPMEVYPTPKMSSLLSPSKEQLKSSQNVSSQYHNTSSSMEPEVVFLKQLQTEYGELKKSDLDNLESKNEVSPLYKSKLPHKRAISHSSYAVVPVLPTTIAHPSFRTVVSPKFPEKISEEIGHKVKLNRATATLLDDRPTITPLKTISVPGINTGVGNENEIVDGEPMHLKRYHRMSKYVKDSKIDNFHGQNVKPSQAKSLVVQLTPEHIEEHVLRPVPMRINHDDNDKERTHYRLFSDNSQAEPFGHELFTSKTHLDEQLQSFRRLMGEHNHHLTQNLNDIKKEESYALQYDTESSRDFLQLPRNPTQERSETTLKPDRTTEESRFHYYVTAGTMSPNKGVLPLEFWNSRWSTTAEKRIAKLLKGDNSKQNLAKSLHPYVKGGKFPSNQTKVISSSWKMFPSKFKSHTDHHASNSSNSVGSKTPPGKSSKANEIWQSDKEQHERQSVYEKFLNSHIPSRKKKVASSDINSKENFKTDTPSSSGKLLTRSKSVFFPPLLQNDVFSNRPNVNSSYVSYTIQTSTSRPGNKILNNIQANQNPRTVSSYSNSTQVNNGFITTFRPTQSSFLRTSFPTILQTSVISQPLSVYRRPGLAGVSSSANLRKTSQGYGSTDRDTADRSYSGGADSKFVNGGSTDGRMYGGSSLKPSLEVSNVGTSYGGSNTGVSIGGSNSGSSYSGSNSGSSLTATNLGSSYSGMNAGTTQGTNTGTSQGIPSTGTGYDGSNTGMLYGSSLRSTSYGGQSTGTLDEENNLGSTYGSSNVGASHSNSGMRVGANTVSSYRQPNTGIQSLKDSFPSSLSFPSYLNSLPMSSYGRPEISLSLPQNFGNIQTSYSSPGQFSGIGTGISNNGLSMLNYGEPGNTPGVPVGPPMTYKSNNGINSAITSGLPSQQLLYDSPSLAEGSRSNSHSGVNSGHPVFQLMNNFVSPSLQNGQIRSPGAMYMPLERPQSSLSSHGNVPRQPFQSNRVDIPNAPSQLYIPPLASVKKASSYVTPSPTSGSLSYKLSHVGTLQSFSSTKARMPSQSYNGQNFDTSLQTYVPPNSGPPSQIPGPINIGVPSQAYGPPNSGILSQTPGYINVGVPSQAYGAPNSGTSQTFGPVKSYGPPIGGSPSQILLNRGVASQSYGASTTGAFSQSSGTPAAGSLSQSYDVPTSGSPSQSYVSLTSGTSQSIGSSTAGILSQSYGYPTPGTPSPSYGSPTPGTPSPSYGSPTPGTPSPSYGSPTPGTPSPSYGSPTSGTPSPLYGSPTPGTPSLSYGSPTPGTPSPSYGSPIPGTPSPSYGSPTPATPSLSYGSPTPGTLSSSYGSPTLGTSPSYGSLTRGSLSQSYESPVTGILSQSKGSQTPSSYGSSTPETSVQSYGVPVSETLAVFHERPSFPTLSQSYERPNLGPPSQSYGTLSLSYRLPNVGRLPAELYSANSAAQSYRFRTRNSISQSNHFPGGGGPSQSSSFSSAHNPRSYSPLSNGAFFQPRRSPSDRTINSYSATSQTELPVTAPKDPYAYRNKGLSENKLSLSFTLKPKPVSILYPLPTTTSPVVETALSSIYDSNSVSNPLSTSYNVQMQSLTQTPHRVASSSALSSPHLLDFTSPNSNVDDTSESESGEAVEYNPPRIKSSESIFPQHRVRRKQPQSTGSSPPLHNLFRSTASFRAHTTTTVFPKRKFIPTGTILPVSISPLSPNIPYSYLPRTRQSHAPRFNPHFPGYSASVVSPSSPSTNLPNTLSDPFLNEFSHQTALRTLGHPVTVIPHLYTAPIQSPISTPYFSSSGLTNFPSLGLYAPSKEVNNSPPSVNIVYPAVSAAPHRLRHRTVGSRAITTLRASISHSRRRKRIRKKTPSKVTSAGGRLWENETNHSLAGRLVLKSNNRKKTDASSHSPLKGSDSIHDGYTTPHSNDEPQSIESTTNMPNNSGERKSSPNYKFQYVVSDTDLNVKFGQREARGNEGDRKGEYFVKMADGRTQVVRYSAGEGGYKAEVTYIDP
ncbi:Insect cuticle protein [Trinorchestia longiramus]|nr:Insect cuticle protein [Trinorchestia longiramus]